MAEEPPKLSYVMDTSVDGSSWDSQNRCFFRIFFLTTCQNAANRNLMESLSEYNVTQAVIAAWSQEVFSVMGIVCIAIHWLKVIPSYL